MIYNGKMPAKRQNKRTLARWLPKQRVRWVKNDNKLRTVAKAETKGYWQAFRRVFDWQPRRRFGWAVWYPARQKCAQATQFRQSSVRRPSTSII